MNIERLFHMKFLRIFIVVLLGLATVEVNAKIILDEQAIEAGKLVVRVSGSIGSVTVKTCPKCPEMTLKIDRKTIVFVDGHVAPLDSRINRHSGPGTVIFNPKDSTVRRLELYAKE